jgi:hypothetical protein
MIYGARKTAHGRAEGVHVDPAVGPVFGMDLRCYLEWVRVTYPRPDRTHARVLGGREVARRCR